MVGTIGPLVQVARRTWISSIGLFMIASVAGGGLLGLALAALAVILEPHTRVLVPIALAAGAAAVVTDGGVLPLRVPTLYRSVPQHWWIIYGPRRAAVLYGLVLGTGITTFIPFMAFYFMLIIAVMSPPWVALACGLTYGAARSAPVLVSSVMIAAGRDARALGHAHVAGRRLARDLAAFTALSLALLLASRA